MKENWYPCVNLIQRIIYILSTIIPYIVFFGSGIYFSIFGFSFNWMGFFLLIIFASVLLSGFLFYLFASKITSKNFLSIEKGELFKLFFKRLYYPLSPAKKMTIPFLERFLKKKKFIIDESELFYTRHFNHYFLWTLHQWFQPHFSDFSYRVFVLNNIDQLKRIKELNLSKQDNVFDIILISERASTYTENFDFSHFTIVVDFAGGGVKNIQWNTISTTSVSPYLDFFSKSLLILFKKKEFPIFLVSNSYQVFRFFRLYFMSF